ncbi:HNH endonuclease [Sphingomonas sp. 1P06PA]|uniref:HNH endonuclease n=1 Tax=Sphingomonas sp. 1P06PA TaxID=554121 RepID=UPI0039A54193
MFERDGWRCHLCHRSTPKRLRGSYKPSAPELDHIVPLAKGGSHTRANTACACRQCNGAKSDRVYGQPSLFSVAA